MQHPSLHRQYRYRDMHVGMLRSAPKGLAMKGGAALPRRIEAKRKAGRPY
jgi:hypothetical protein